MMEMETMVGPNATAMMEKGIAGYVDYGIE